MKNKTLIIVNLFVALSAIACLKKDRSLEERTGLPKATQTGMNTLGALVNDELVVNKRPTFSFSPSLEAGYTYLEGSHRQVFVIRATDYVSPNLKGIDIAIDTTITEGLIYTLYKKQDTVRTMYFIYKGNYDYRTVEYTITPPLKGQLTITKYDPKARILSGTFFFDAINLKGDKVSVTDGRFDVKY